MRAVLELCGSRTDIQNIQEVPHAGRYVRKDMRFEHKIAYATGKDKDGVCVGSKSPGLTAPHIRWLTTMPKADECCQVKGAKPNIQNILYFDMFMNCILTSSH